MRMRLFTPESSNIESVEYNRDSKELKVTFNNESEYKYEKVPANIVSGLLLVDSVGKYIGQNIVKGGYSFEKVR